MWSKDHTPSLGYCSQLLWGQSLIQRTLSPWEIWDPFLPSTYPSIPLWYPLPFSAAPSPNPTALWLWQVCGVVDILISLLRLLCLYSERQCTWSITANIRWIMHRTQGIRTEWISLSFDGGTKMRVISLSKEVEGKPPRQTCTVIIYKENEDKPAPWGTNPSIRLRIQNWVIEGS